MGWVEKALRFVENKFAREITLDEIAEASDVSRYHLSRAFAIRLPSARCQ
jgi:AraC family transcriptional regulator